MRFDPDDAGVTSPIDEWTSRMSPFLLAANPHQQCIARARAAGSPTVNAFCTCPTAPCDKPCCAPPLEEW